MKYLGYTVSARKNNGVVTRDYIVKINSEINSMKILLDLPTDILLVIFAYIPSYHLISSVSVVCGLFRDILNSQTFWKRRYNQKSGRTLNSLRDWRIGCCQNDHLQRIIEGKATVNTYKGLKLIFTVFCPNKIAGLGQSEFLSYFVIYNRIYCYSEHGTYHAR